MLATFSCLVYSAAGGGAAAKQPFAASITASSTATTACEGGRLATPWLVDPSANKPVPPPVFGAGFLQVFPGLIFRDGSAWFWIFLNFFWISCVFLDLCIANCPFGRTPQFAPDPHPSDSYMTPFGILSVPVAAS